METLDLHGVKHEKAEIMIEDFVLTHDCPLKIITGNSITMRSIVEQVAIRNKLSFEPENHWNLGSLILTEQ